MLIRKPPEHTATARLRCGALSRRSRRLALPEASQALAALKGNPITQGRGRPRARVQAAEPSPSRPLESRPSALVVDRVHPSSEDVGGRRSRSATCKFKHSLELRPRRCAGASVGLVATEAEGGSRSLTAADGCIQSPGQCAGAFVSRMSGCGATAQLGPTSRSAGIAASRTRHTHLRLVGAAVTGVASPIGSLLRSWPGISPSTNRTRRSRSDTAT